MIDQIKFNDVINKNLILNYEKFEGVLVKKGYEKYQGYADNFGLQWNKFQLTQFDSYNGTSNSEERLFQCSRWDPNSLKNKFV